MDRTVKICVVIITVIVCAATIYWIGAKISQQQTVSTEGEIAEQHLLDDTANRAYENWISAATNKWVQRTVNAKTRSEEAAIEQGQAEELKRIRTAFATRDLSGQGEQRFIDLANAGMDNDKKATATAAH